MVEYYAAIKNEWSRATCSNTSTAIKVLLENRNHGSYSKHRRFKRGIVYPDVAKLKEKKKKGGMITQRLETAGRCYTLALGGKCEDGVSLKLRDSRRGQDWGYRGEAGASDKSTRRRERAKMKEKLRLHPSSQYLLLAGSAGNQLAK